MRIKEDGDYKLITINVAIEGFDDFLTYYYRSAKKQKIDFKTGFIDALGEELYMTEIIADEKTFDKNFGKTMYFEMEDKKYIDYYVMFDTFMEILDVEFEKTKKVKEYIVYKNSRDDVFVRFKGKPPSIIDSYMVYYTMLGKM